MNGVIPSAWLHLEDQFTIKLTQLTCLLHHFANVANEDVDEAELQVRKYICRLLLISVKLRCVETCGQVHKGPGIEKI